MKALKDLPLSKAALLSSKPAEEDRVVELFRNRAELKKAHQGLQDEIQRLKDRLKQQEGATARYQEMLEQLEGQLGNPESGYPALVFYQLRGLWAGAREMLKQFVAELERQADTRERKQFMAEGNRRQFDRRKELEAALRRCEAATAEATLALGDLTAHRAGLTAFWHHLKRRDLDARIAEQRVAVSRCDQELTYARASLDEFDRQSSTDFPGLSVDARRAINLAAIAYAEVFGLRLARTSIYGLAKAAVGSREFVDEYGDKPACELLMAEIARARTLLQQRGNLAQEVKMCSERLHEVAQFAAVDEAIPIAESVAPTIGEHRGAAAFGARVDQLPNVLVDDAWDIFKALLR